MPFPTLKEVMQSPFIDVVKHYEGFRERAYQCSAGKWTIGYGHTFESRHEFRHKTISIDTADMLLSQDMEVALKAVKRLAGHALRDEPAHRAIALASWVFNLGQGNLESSTLLKRVRDSRWRDCEAEIKRWVYCAQPDGTKVKLAGLVKRRNSEADYFRDGTIKIY